MKNKKLTLGLLVAFAATTGAAFAQEHEEHAAPTHAAPADEHADPVHAPAIHAQPNVEHGEHAAPATDEHGTPDEHAAHAEHGEHAGGHHGPEAINWTDFGDKKKPAFLALLLNFGILVGLYYTLGKKPVAEGLKQRRITIGKDIEEAQKLLAEAKERAKKYQADLGNADADAETARAGLVSTGKGEVERLMRDARERAERMKRDAERMVEQERKQLRQDLVAETVDLAVDEAKTVLSRNVTPDDHARLANDLLAELAKRPAAGRTVGGAS